MDDWFDWNGVRCTTYGMHALSQPSVISPMERSEPIQIPGRSGSLTFLEGTNIFDDLVLACSCIIDDPYLLAYDSDVTRILAITKWLKGSGKVKFANRPNGFYQARIVNQMSFDKIMRGQKHLSFQVQFSCKPSFYLDSGVPPVTITTSPYDLTNLGNIESEPLLKVIGTGEGTISVGGKSMLITSLNGLQYLMLDSEARIAYKGVFGLPADPLTLLGTRAVGDWISLPTGVSSLTFAGGITSIGLVPRWRTI